MDPEKRNTAIEIAKIIREFLVFLVLMAWIVWMFS
jgi:hypothetical protein